MKQIESLFLGIIAALGALVLELVVLLAISITTGSEIYLSFDVLDTVPRTLLIFYGFLLASVIIEESLKYLMITKKVEKFSIDRQIVLNALLVGIGFALVEIVLIYERISASTDAFFYRNILEVVLIHILTAGVMGYFVAVLNPNRIGTLIKAVSLASLVHLLYNILSTHRNSYSELFIVGLLTLLLLINIVNVLRVNKRLAF